MGCGHVVRSGATAVVPIVREKCHNGSDLCVCSITVGYKYLYHGPKVLRRTGIATIR